MSAASQCTQDRPKRCAREGSSSREECVEERDLSYSCALRKKTGLPGLLRLDTTSFADGKMCGRNGRPPFADRPSWLHEGYARKHRPGRAIALRTAPMRWRSNCALRATTKSCCHDWDPDHPVSLASNWAGPSDPP